MGNVDEDVGLGKLGFDVPPVPVPCGGGVDTAGECDPVPVPVPVLGLVPVPVPDGVEADCEVDCVEGACGLGSLGVIERVIAWTLDFRLFVLAHVSLPRFLLFQVFVW